MSEFIFTIPDAPTFAPASSAAGATDHVAVALSRLLEQFKNKANVVALVTALITPSNDVETELRDLLTKRQVNTAVGAQLDLIGKLVGQPRNGAGDVDYARFIAARIATNNSKSRVEDLISVAKLVINDALDTITVERRSVASVVVRVTGNVVTDAVAGICVSFLRDARAAGVKLTLETQPDLDANTFFTALSSFTTGALSIGGTVVTVDTTNGFPTSGSIVVEVGGANQETVTYGNLSTTQFLNCSPLTKTHSSGVRVDASVQLGKGWGDGGDAGQPTLTPYANVGTTGGRLEDARE